MCREAESDKRVIETDVGPGKDCRERQRYDQMVNAIHREKAARSGEGGVTGDETRS